MARILNICIVFVLFVPILFLGCASTGPKAADIQPESATTQPKIKVNEFVLGVGDSLDFSVYRNDDLKMSTKINPSGLIYFPLIGDVRAAGRTIPDLRSELRERFSKYLVDPQITISISAVQSVRIMVLGEVKNPGVFSLDTDLSVMEAVAKAGGWTLDAKLSDVVLLRNVAGKLETQALNMGTALEGGSVPNNKQLQSKDIIYVPTKTIADISRFMTYLANILSPIVLTESGIVLMPQVIDAISGKKTSTGLSIPTK
jgi:polysaccharide export outer membrane protein